MELGCATTNPTQVLRNLACSLQRAVVLNWAFNMEDAIVISDSDDEQFKPGKRARITQEQKAKKVWNALPCNRISFTDHDTTSSLTIYHRSLNKAWRFDASSETLSLSFSLCCLHIETSF